MKHEMRKAISTVLGCVALAALPAQAAVTQATLDQIRQGSSGIELAGIVVATVDAKGRLQTLASGCARFDAASPRCIQPLRPDGVMRIASVSKMVTAAQVVQIVRRRQLALDKDVSPYLGFELRNPTFPAQPITLRQLLNHTSSIEDGQQYWLPWPQRLDANSAGTHRFDSAHAPGTYFRYSNFNYVLLGQIVESVSNKTFGTSLLHDQFRRPRIDAGYNWHLARPIDASRVVTLYRRQPAEGGSWQPDGPWQAQVDDFAGLTPNNAIPWDYTPGANAAVFSPHGGLRIALPDIALWLSRLDARTLQLMCARPFVLQADDGNGDSEGGFYSSFGLGIHTFELPGFGTVWGHFGEAYGLRAAVLRDPRTRRVWAYAISGYGDEPQDGLDAVQQALLTLFMSSDR
jgi:CubicO group peptidase (beta-lactamase class C family)